MIPLGVHDSDSVLIQPSELSVKKPQDFGFWPLIIEQVTRDQEGVNLFLDRKSHRALKCLLRGGAQVLPNTGLVTPKVCAQMDVSDMYKTHAPI